MIFNITHYYYYYYHYYYYYVEAKLSLKEERIRRNPVPALRLCTGRTSHRGSRGIAVLYKY